MNYIHDLQEPYSFPATLSVDGQVLATGRATLDIGSKSGKFLTKLEHHLGTKSHPQALLTGKEEFRELVVNNVSPCENHWHFKFSEVPPFLLA